MGSGLRCLLSSGLWAGPGPAWFGPLGTLTLRDPFIVMCAVSPFAGMLDGSAGYNVHANNFLETFSRVPQGAAARFPSARCATRNPGARVLNRPWCSIAFARC